MEPTARYSKRSQGYSLIETLVALLLLTIVMLALMESVVLYTQTNMTNMLRDEGVRATQDILYEVRTRGFNNVPTGTSTLTQRRNLRTTHWDYTITLTVTQVDTQMKSAVAITTWTFLNRPFSHQASTLIPRGEGS